MDRHRAPTQRSLRLAGVTGLLALGVAGTASGGVIDFEGLVHGEIVGGQFLSDGVLITAVNPNRPFDLAIAFDTNQTGTADPDLEGPNWSLGNLAPNTNLGNILIIAENNFDPGADGILDDPDDEGMTPAGQIIFDFDTPIIEFGLDFIDLDHPDTTPTLIRFFGGSDLVLEIDVAEYTNPVSAHYDPSVAYGNHSANHYSPIALALEGDDLPPITRVVIVFGESGGLDNVFFTEVPAPGSLALIALAAVAGVNPRRRRTS